jgi:hypothetical protein
VSNRKNHFDEDILGDGFTLRVNKNFEMEITFEEGAIDFEEIQKIKQRKEDIYFQLLDPELPQDHHRIGNKLCPCD